MLTEDGVTRTDASSSTRILAKPDETLEEHTFKATQWFTKYLRWRSGRLYRAAKALKIELKELESRLFATCYLHDIGKAGKAFQAYDFGRGHQSRGIPHPLLSLPFVYAAVSDLELGASKFYFEVLTVMTHHTSFYDNLYRAGYRDFIIKEDHYLLREALEFYYRLPEAHRVALGFEFPFELREPFFGETVSSLLDRAGDFYRVSRQIRPVYSFFVATLKYADWLASGNDPSYDYSTVDMAERLLEHLRRKNPESFKGWSRFQHEAHKRKGNIIINAPTGQGKTEAALLWAASNGLKGRVAYLLPARVSTNAMYERLKEAFVSGVGISHGTSDIKIAEEEAWDEKAYKTRILRSSTFMEPVTVATVDQLLLSLFNWRHWELLEEAASDSAIIFDEIHAYDPYTTSLIVIASRDLTGRGAKLAFMTATLPSYLRNFLMNELNVKLVRDREHGGLKRHLVRFMPQPIQTVINNVVRDFKNGKHILMVLNTVEEAIDVYQAVKKEVEKGEAEHVVLYHSRFMEMHRQEKERLIRQGAEAKEGFIAITTQVVEVSLDIDYDVLYTQLAPVDALIQRMGRVNRRGKKTINEDGNIFIFLPGEHDGFVYGQKNLDRALQIVPKLMAGKVLAESEVPTLIERQYPPKEARAELQSELEYLGEVLNEFRQNLWHIQTIQLKDSENVLRRLAKTRKERFPTVEAIPLCFKDSAIDKLPSSRRLEKIRYYVRLPLYKFGDSLKPLEEGLYASVKYSEELGATEPIPSDTIW